MIAKSGSVHTIAEKIVVEAVMVEAMDQGPSYVTKTLTLWNDL